MSSEISSVEIKALHVNRTVKFACAKLTIKQNFKPNWNSEPAYGKMDNIATYANTTRNVSFSFTCLAKQEIAAATLKNDIDTFVQMQYPLYTAADQGRVLRAPPFFKIRSLNGKLYNDFEGYIESFDIVPGSEGGTTPLIINAGGRQVFAERRYDITIGLTVMHSDNPGFIDQNNFSGDEGFYFSSGDSVPRPKPIDVGGLVDSGVAAIEGTVQGLREQLGAYSSTYNNGIDAARNAAAAAADLLTQIPDDE